VCGDVSIEKEEAEVEEEWTLSEHGVRNHEKWSIHDFVNVSNTSNSKTKVGGGRNKKTKKFNYKSSWDSGYSDDDADDSEFDDDEMNVKDNYDQAVPKIDKIIFKREFKEPKLGKCEKYLVKFQEQAYVHSRWLPEEEILALPRGKTRLRKFNEKSHSPWYIQATGGKGMTNDETEGKMNYYNPQFDKIDRIIAKRENRRMGAQYLVKWRSLAYEYCSWEHYEFIRKRDDFPEAWSRYEHFSEIPGRKFLQFKRRHHTATKRSSRFTSYSTENKFKNNNSLRSYQADGVNWLMNNWHAFRPCILADEMGLGKTVQAVTFLNALVMQERMRGPYLVVAPLSTLPHWEREFRTWTDLNCVVYHGYKASRKLIVQHEWDFAGADKDIARYNRKFNVLISTREIVISDVKVLSKIVWRCIIVDEAHSLKNRNSTFFQRLGQLQKEHCVLLTGTPIQNNMKELFSLLNFLSPKRYPSEDEFLERFSKDKLAGCASSLKEELQPRILQRLKYVVEPDLAVRVEKIIWVELTLFQKKWYKALFEKSIGALKMIGGSRPSLLNISMQLRKCCNHPFLLSGAEDSMTDPGASAETICENLVRASGKLVLLDKLLPKLQREGHKVLIFSQMTRVLDILEDYLCYRGYSYERIDGSVRGDLRQEAIDRYQQSEAIFAFLLSTRAGGLGINLMAADTVVIYDSDWNPMNDLQAIARVHRIGQKKQVKVYRLVTRNSYEQVMFKHADKKRALQQVIMSDKKLSKTEIQSMLKNGAVATFLDEKKLEKEIEEFDKATIEEILATRTEMVDTTEKRTDDSIFSEAIFTAEKEDTKVDINDPTFWSQIGIQPAVNDGVEFLSSRRSRQSTSKDLKVNLVREEKGDDIASNSDDYSSEDSSNTDDESSGNDFVPDPVAVDGSFENDKDGGGSIEKAVVTHVWGHWTKIAACISSKQREKLVGCSMEPSNTNYELLEYACSEYCALLFQNLARFSSDKQEIQERWVFILKDTHFSCSILKTLHHQLKSTGDKVEKEIMSEIKELDTLTMLERISPTYSEFPALVRKHEAIQDVLLKLERLFILKAVVERLGHQDSSTVSPLFQEMKLGKAISASREYWSPRWDQALTMATYEYGWGLVDTSAAKKFGFVESSLNKNEGVEPSSVKSRKWLTRSQCDKRMMAITCHFRKLCLD